MQRLRALVEYGEHGSTLPLAFPDPGRRRGFADAPGHRLVARFEGAVKLLLVGQRVFLIRGGDGRFPREKTRDPVTQERIRPSALAASQGVGPRVQGRLVVRTTKITNDLVETRPHALPVPSS